jgi:hypothetical protein
MGGAMVFFFGVFFYFLTRSLFYLDGPSLSHTPFNHLMGGTTPCVLILVYSFFSFLPVPLTW